MEENFIEISNPGNNESLSHFKDFFGRVVRDDNDELLDGEYQFGEYPFAIIRFHEGMIDGNIYDQYGDIIERYPALIYQSNYTSCTEYWTKGFPDGNPAINFDFGEYEEYWKDKQLITIRKAHNWDDISQEQFTHKYIFEEKAESIIKSIVFSNDIDDYDFFEDEYNYDDYNFDDYNKKWSDPPSEINEEKEIDKILSFNNYLSFQQRLFKILEIKKMTAPELYTKIGMSQQTFNNVKNSSLVTYNNAVVLAFGLELTFEQMIKFVNFARKGFGHNPQQDKFLREAIENKDYSIYNLNRKIEKVNEKIRKINEEFFEHFGKNKENEIKLFLLQKEENQTQTTKTKTSSKKKDDKKSSNEKNTIKQK
ncbi:MAG: hypothetical protein UH788_06980 [Treponemataceae bacterium]|nr:hypothetical protein [Treponemataceae bacterium]